MSPGRRPPAPRLRPRAPPPGPVRGPRPWAEWRARPRRRRGRPATRPRGCTGQDHPWPVRGPTFRPAPEVVRGARSTCVASGDGRRQRVPWPRRQSVGGLADGGSGAWPGGDPPRHQVHGMGRILLGHACSARLHPFAQDGAVEASVPARCALMGHAPRGGPRAQRRHAHAKQARRRGYGDEIGVSRDWMCHSGDFLPGSARPQRTTGMGPGYPWGGVSPPQA